MMHPDNIYSINNLLKKDFIKLSDIVLKIGPRNIYRKNNEKTLLAVMASKVVGLIIGTVIEEESAYDFKAPKVGRI